MAEAIATAFGGSRLHIGNMNGGSYSMDHITADLSNNLLWTKAITQRLQSLPMLFDA
jgi:hypothetical protein